jgi:predicted DNA-binding protein (MmcQ/YjbR family)
MGMKPRRAASSPPADPAFAVLRAICAELPGVEETWSWGHPNFRAGKPPRIFAVFERVKGSWICGVRVGPEVRDALLGEGDPYCAVPNDRAGDWIGVSADRVDRGRLRALVAEAHAAVMAPRPRRR